MNFVPSKSIFLNGIREDLLELYKSDGMYICPFINIINFKTGDNFKATHQYNKALDLYELRNNLIIDLSGLPRAEKWIYSHNIRLLKESEEVNIF